MYNSRINTFLKQIVYHIVFLSFFLIYSINISAQDVAIKKKIVILDAGHGGMDTGAKGSKSLEKDLALSICLKVGKYVNDNLPDVKIVYTRSTDVFVPLHERAQIANDNKADLFISIHVNANPKSSPFGTSSHVLGLHRANENFEVAKRENSVILLEEDYSTRYENFDPNIPESYIMFNLMQNVYLEQSIYLGQLVQNQFRERAQRKDRGVKQQGLLVLAQISMPGILVETGFITNLEEEEYLMSEAGQDYIASAVYRAIKDYLHKINEIDQEGLDLSNNSTSKNEIKTDSNSLARVDSNQIIFKIQVSSSSKRIPLDSTYFNNLVPVSEYYSNGYYKYTIGEEMSFKDIKKLKKDVMDYFPDAFIIAFKKGEKIPVDQAIKESKN